jgi:cytochrome c oxidase cbb3-type subunit 3
LQNSRANFIFEVVLLTFLVLRFPGSATAGAAPGQQNPPPVTDAGRHLFERHCVVCHGVNGKGGRGPSLNRALLEHAPDDAALKSVISDGIPPAMPPFWFLTEEDLAILTPYVRSLGKIPSEPLPGDPVRGARIFARGGCANCHSFAGTGSGFGPDLTKMTVQRSPSHIKKAIANPSENLPEDFLFIEATTAGGDKIEGIRANEDTFSIQIKDSAGQFHSFRKRDLKDLKKLRGQTPMPAFATAFTESELDDLVAYLAAGGKP